MSKIDCSETDVILAESALYVATDPRFEDAEAVAKEMSRLYGAEIKVTDVAKAVSLYTQTARDKKQKKLASNQAKINKEFRAIAGRIREVDALKNQVDRGIFTERIVSEKTKSHALEVLDAQKDTLNAQKASELRARHHKEMFDILRAGGTIPSKMRTETYRSANEELWSTKDALAQQELKIKEKLRQLSEMEKPQKRLVPSGVNKKGLIRENVILSDTEAAAINRNINEAKAAVRREQDLLAQMEKNNELHDILKRLLNGEAVEKVVRTPKEKDALQESLQKQIRDIETISRLKEDIDNQRRQIESNVFDVKPTKEMVQINEEIMKLRRTRQILGNRIKAKMDEQNTPIVFRGIREFQSVRRTMGASFDIPLGRQGLLYMVSHPFKTAKITKMTLMRSWTEDEMIRIEEEWKQDPLYEDFVRLKLLKEAEENFDDNILLQRKWLGALHRVSARQQHIMLTEMRMNLYKDMANGLPLDGVPTEEQKKMIARHVLITTGVGQSQFIDRNAQALSDVFFAPKYTASRFQFIAGYSYWKSDPAVRSLIIKEYMKTAAGWTALMLSYQMLAGNLPSLADMFDWDEEEVKDATGAMFGGRNIFGMASADLGKIRQGHTRVDAGAGLTNVITPMWQIASGRFVSSKTGKEYDLDSEDYGAMTRAMPLLSFARKRFAPILSDIATYGFSGGKNVVGDDVAPIRFDGGVHFNSVGAQNMAKAMLLPYAWPAMYEITQDPDSDLTWKTVALISTMFSLGGSMYDAPGEAILPDEEGSGGSSRSLKRSNVRER